jgi:dihydrolipoamide dehydrogenase
VSGELSLDIDVIQKRKNSVMDQLRKSLNHLISKKKIDLVYGEAEVLKNKTIQIKGNSSEDISADYILLAGGSKPVIPSSWKVDSSLLMTSDEILNFKAIPKTLLIIGGE